MIIFRVAITRLPYSFAEGTFGPCEPIFRKGELKEKIMIKKSTMGTSRTRSLNLPAAAVALLLMGSTLFAPASSLAQAVRIKAAYSAISAGLGSIWTAKETDRKSVV